MTVRKLFNDLLAITKYMFTLPSKHADLYFSPLFVQNI